MAKTKGEIKESVRPSDGCRFPYNKNLEKKGFKTESRPNPAAAAGGGNGNAPKALDKMNKTELTKTAADEGVAIPEGATNADIARAIEAARTAKGAA